MCALHIKTTLRIGHCHQSEKASSHPHKKYQQLNQFTKKGRRKGKQLSTNYSCPSFFKDSGKSNSKSANFFFRQTQHI
jgi:hypothetical protein